MKELSMFKISLGLLALSLVCLINEVEAFPTIPTIVGPQQNYDTTNHVGCDDVLQDCTHGKEAHGHRIILRDTDISRDYVGAFDYTRYGAANIYQVGKDAYVEYKATWNGTAWSATTPAGYLNTYPTDSCWPLGTPDFGPAYPCDHFGVYSINVPTAIEYYWLVEQAGFPGSTVEAPIFIPNPTMAVSQPVGAVLPVVVANIQAPEPAQGSIEFGEATWNYITCANSAGDANINKLLLNNADIVDHGSQAEWQLLQKDYNSGNPLTGQLDFTSVQPDAVNGASVICTVEVYAYTGTVDPITKEAFSLNGDTTAPDPSDKGIWIGTQTFGVDLAPVVAPSPVPTVAPTPAPIPCSGVDEVITMISPRAGWLTTNLGAYRVNYLNQVTTGNQINFAVGDLYSYSGFLDLPGVFCLADTGSFTTPAVPTPTPTAIPTATPTAVPTVAPTAVPTAIPTVAPTAPPSSCTVPKGAEKIDKKGVISSITNAGFIVNGVEVILAPCTVIKLNGASGIKVGQKVEWSYINTTKVVVKVVIN